MPNKTRVLVEAFVVATVMAIIFGVVHTTHMMISKSAAMTHLALVLQVALVGFLGHVLFEYSGANAWYARQYSR